MPPRWAAAAAALAAARLVAAAVPASVMGGLSEDGIGFVIQAVEPLLIHKIKHATFPDVTINVPKMGPLRAGTVTFSDGHVAHFSCEKGGPSNTCFQVTYSEGGVVHVKLAATLGLGVHYDMDSPPPFPKESGDCTYSSSTTLFKATYTISARKGKPQVTDVHLDLDLGKFTMDCPHAPNAIVSYLVNKLQGLASQEIEKLTPKLTDKVNAWVQQKVPTAVPIPASLPGSSGLELLIGFAGVSSSSSWYTMLLGGDVVQTASPADLPPVPAPAPPKWDAARPTHAQFAVAPYIFDVAAYSAWRQGKLRFAVTHNAVQGCLPALNTTVLGRLVPGLRAYSASWMELRVAATRAPRFSVARRQGARPGADLEAAAPVEVSFWVVGPGAPAEAFALAADDFRADARVDVVREPGGQQAVQVNATRANCTFRVARSAVGGVNLIPELTELATWALNRFGLAAANDALAGLEQEGYMQLPWVQVPGGGGGWLHMQDFDVYSKKSKIRVAASLDYCTGCSPPPKPAKKRWACAPLQGYRCTEVPEGVPGASSRLACELSCARAACSHPRQTHWRCDGAEHRCLPVAAGAANATSRAACELGCAQLPQYVCDPAALQCVSAPRGPDTMSYPTCELACALQRQYGCDPLLGKCIDVPPGTPGGTGLADCEAVCQASYVCNHTTAACERARPGAPNATYLPLCKAACFLEKQYTCDAAASQCVAVPPGTVPGSTGLATCESACALRYACDEASSVCRHVNASTPGATGLAQCELGCRKYTCANGSCSAAPPGAPGATGLVSCEEACLPPAATCAEALARSCAADLGKKAACAACELEHAAALDSAGCAAAEKIGFCALPSVPCMERLALSCGASERNCSTCVQRNAANLTAEGCTMVQRSEFCAGEGLLPSGGCVVAFLSRCGSTVRNATACHACTSAAAGELAAAGCTILQRAGFCMAGK